MSNITFNAEDLGFIAQVALSEIPRRRGPNRHILREIAADFERMAKGEAPATKENVECWFLEYMDSGLDVVWDIYDLLANVEQEGGGSMKQYTALGYLVLASAIITYGSLYLILS